MTYRIIGGIAAGTAGLIAGGVMSTAYKVFKGYLGRHGTYDDDPPGDKEYAGEDIYERYIEEIRWNESLEYEDVSITSRDGLTLMGHYLPAEGEAVRNMVLVHGYHSTGFKDFAGQLRYYHPNCNILLIEQRAHRRSEGEYITMGIRESEDVALWCEFMNEKAGSDLPMYLHGVSMGGATVTMAEGEALPENVKGIIADCGFTDPEDIAIEVSKTYSGGMTVPLMPLVNRFAKKKAGITLTEKRAPEILANAKIPILFIHGTADRFVPPHMSVRNYQACAAPKKICLVDGSTHAMSYLKDPEKYTVAVEDLFAGYGERELFIQFEQRDLKGGR